MVNNENSTFKIVSVKGKSATVICVLYKRLWMTLELRLHLGGTQIDAAKGEI